jgi:hypothetical protein
MAVAETIQRRASAALHSLFTKGVGHVYINIRSCKSP